VEGVGDPGKGVFFSISTAIIAAVAVGVVCWSGCDGGKGVEDPRGMNVAAGGGKVSFEGEGGFVDYSKSHFGDACV